MTSSAVTLGLLSAAASFNPAGILLLAGGILAAALFYIAGRDKRYKKDLAGYETALAKYQKDLEEYNATVRLLAARGGLDLSQVDADVLDEQTLAAITAAASPARPGGEVLLTGVDERTAAMLLAIVCDTAGGDPAQLRFRSVKAL